GGPVLTPHGIGPGRSSLREEERPAPRTAVRIGELLVSRGLITTEQLDRALVEQTVSGRRLGAEIIRLGLISERQLIEALADQLRRPVTDLRTMVPDPRAAASSPEHLARTFEALPVRLLGDILEVALADVLNDALRAELEDATGCRVVGVLAPPSE